MSKFSSEDYLFQAEAFLSGFLEVVLAFEVSREAYRMLRNQEGNSRRNMWSKGFKKEKYLKKYAFQEDFTDR
jgi:hypothetical protein